MRTTVRLDDQLLTEAKKLAHDTGRTLTALIEDSLRETIARARNRSERKPVKLRTFPGDGLRPGVDLDDSASLLDLMEGGHDPQ